MASSLAPVTVGDLLATAEEECARLADPPSPAAATYRRLLLAVICSKASTRITATGLRLSANPTLEVYEMKDADNGDLILAVRPRVQ